MTQWIFDEANHTISSISISALVCACHSDAQAAFHRGISFKTQALYALVFMTRYIDLLFRWVSVYNFVMKLFFISSSCHILYIMMYLRRMTPSIDTFKIEYLLGPSFFLSLIFNYAFEPTEILWTFSIYLESVAIFPQLFIQLQTHYLAALGLYRALYLPNWIYRYACVGGFSVTAGLVQTGLYPRLLLLLHGQKFELPA
ncbi:ER lumen protein retaining receptor-domain-containing protein [Suillus subalutaceus]|uniref:ER lumen protein retaining receptor-domain-containing protein n=1 Tax=Suillus subalutaceus TaxID=48586 RepID=UPI001B864664|nr:ER lumen protein retaining receptor-domain-containing protein [Suillus subalutaceus]KAG1844220.1 ER lumen protein retaining receptor-domain-containing protein [Suillus subalutaceus]